MRHWFAFSPPSIEVASSNSESSEKAATSFTNNVTCDGFVNPLLHSLPGGEGIVSPPWEWRTDHFLERGSYLEDCPIQIFEIAVQAHQICLIRIATSSWWMPPDSTGRILLRIESLCFMIHCAARGHSDSSCGTQDVCCVLFVNEAPLFLRSLQSQRIRTRTLNVKENKKKNNGRTISAPSVIRRTASKAPPLRFSASSLGPSIQRMTTETTRVSRKLRDTWVQGLQVSLKSRAEFS